MPHHAEHLSSALHRAVSSVLARGLHDERIRGLISVTRVKIAPDGRQATVFVSVLPAEHGTLTLRGLRHAAPRIQAELGQFVRLKRTPRLGFELDHSIKKQAEVHSALADVREEDSAEEPATITEPDDERKD